MLHLLGALRAFLWFFWQCSIVGGIGAIWFWIPFVCVVALLVLNFRRTPSATRRRFWLLLLLPAIWMFVGVWGGYFWLDWQRKPFIRNPAWVNWPVDCGFWLFLLIAMILIGYLRNGRTFATLFALVNLYFMLGMSLLAGMALSGTWL